MGAGDDQDVRILSKSASFPICLPRAQPSSASAESPICEPRPLETTVLLSPRTTGTMAEQRTLAFLFAVGKFTIRAIVSERVLSARSLRVLNVCSVLSIKG